MTDETTAPPAPPVPPRPDRPVDTRSRVTLALVVTLVALAVFGLGGLADHFYFANGVAIEWRMRPAGAAPSDREASITLGETVEHDISIPTDHRPVARYVELWRVAEHGVPSSMPPLDAVVRARLLVPQGASRGLNVRTEEAFEVEVDGEVLDPSDRVPAGWHDVSVHWHGALNQQTHFELTWENGEAVPRALLHLPGGDWPSTRTSFWALIAGLALLLGMMSVRAGAAPTPALMRSRTLAIATLLVVLFGTTLRAYDYDIEPDLLENYDEYFNVWNGWSLLEDGTSRGWSAWPSAYRAVETDTEYFRFWGTRLTVVSPYFENLPLMHLLVGAVCHLRGVTDYRDAQVADGRIVALGLSALTIWLLILITRRLVRAGPGPWMAGLLWAATPTLVLQTRVIKEELLLIPLALGTLYFFLRWHDEGRRDRDLYLAACCAGVAILAKIPGAILVPGLVMLLVSRGDSRAGVKAIGTALVVGALPLFLLAIWQGSDVFFAASAAQTGGRGLHFNLYPRFLDAPQVNGWFMGRGWLLFLWVAAMGALYTWHPQRRAVILIPLALYFTAIGVGAGNNTLGWYVLPVVAYLCVAAGAFLGDLYERPDLLRGTLFGLLFVMYTFNFVLPIGWLTDRGMSATIRPAVMGSVLFLIAPYCLVQVWPRFRPLARATFVLSLIACLAVASHVVFRWEDLWPAFHNLDRAPYFP